MATEIIPTFVCSVCENSLTDADIKVKCTKDECGTLTCYTCVKQMIEMMFGASYLNYPFKCGQCAEVLDQTIFLQCLMNRNQYEKFVACIFPLYWAKDCLQASEALVQCPFCPYFEIHTTDACTAQFFLCQHPSCQRKSCLTCLHAIENANEVELQHHLHCSELLSYKQLIEKALAVGSQPHCPHCELSGLKDDGCTHMTCERCENTWCYLCGRKERECISFSAHDDNWQFNQGRCPMGLSSIHEHDARWPADDRDCLEYFHRYRTLIELFGVLQLIGEEKFNEVNQYFGLVETSGYSIEDIKNSPNQILIDYSSQTDA